MIFRSALFHLHVLLQDKDCFLSFFIYLKACKESEVGIVVGEKLGRDLKSNVSSFIKGFFCFVLKVEIHFRELIRKKLGRVCVKGSLA